MNAEAFAQVAHKELRKKMDAGFLLHLKRKMEKLQLSYY
jgi:hypothetical protein